MLSSVNAILSAALVGLLSFMLSFVVWLSIFAALAGGTFDGTILYASTVLAAVTAGWFGFSFWRSKRRGDGPYWRKVFPTD
jgi:hypothetical protein